MNQPLHYRTATELVRMMGAGEITSEALTRAMLDRINTCNPPLNAVVDINEDPWCGEHPCGLLLDHLRAKSASAGFW